MNEHIINEIMQSICMSVKINGHTGQLFDSDFPEESREVIATQLREKNISSVRISKYADVYFPADLEDCEKIKLIDRYRANAPSAYQAALDEDEMQEQEMKAAISAFMLGAALAEILDFLNDDEDWDDE